MNRFFYLVPLFALSLGACANPSVSQTSTPPPGPLLKITSTGGLCVYGGCQAEMILNSDGAYTLMEGKGPTQQGNLDQGRIAQLVESIRTANFSQIQSQPFTDICPTAYDGTEITYTFYTAQGVETISSCKIAIDANEPLFKMADALWQEAWLKK